MQQKRGKFYQKKWFLWLCLILFPPIGIILLWLIHKEMKQTLKIVLTVIFSIWFIILLFVPSTNSSDSQPKPVAEDMSTIASDSINSNSKQSDSSDSTQDKNQMPRELSVQDAEDASLSLFTEIVMQMYNEIPWGEGTDNGVIIESNYDVTSQSGTVAISYILMDDPNSGTEINILFSLDNDQAIVSKIEVNSIEQEIPNEFNNNFLIWKLLDINYEP